MEKFTKSPTPMEMIGKIHEGIDNINVAMCAYRQPNKSYAGGVKVKAPFNNDLLLKCTTAGTTSASTLNCSSNKAGDSITDGGVVWSVESLGAQFASESHTHSTSDITSGVVAIANGGTGATTASNACANLNAYSKNGGIVSGAVSVNKGTNWGQFVAYSGSGYYRAFEASDECIRLDVRNNLTTDNRRFFQVSNSLGSADIRSAIIMTDSINGVESTYKILGDHNTKAYITETWSSGSSWYRKYSDGWVEQGGYIDIEAFTQKIDKTITLNTPMANTTYSVNLQMLTGGNYWSVVQDVNVSARSLASFNINLHQAQTSGYVDVGAHRRIWEVKGWGA